MVSLYVKGLILGSMLILASAGALWILDQERISLLNAEMRELAWQSDDARLFLTYAERLDGNNSELACGLLEKRLGQQIEKTTELSKRIDAYRNANVFGSEYYAIKKTFIYRSLELWLNFVKFKEDCEGDVNYIFYFYQENDIDQSICPYCVVEESVLNEIPKKCPNTWVFAVPINSDIDLIELLKLQNNITTPPALIINGEHIHREFTSEEEILSEINCGENPFQS